MIKTNNKKDKWIKLICGASNEDIVAIEDLCAIYTAAGVDYIDVAAEESIVHYNAKGLRGRNLQKLLGLMITISDGNDMHFRKAKFDPLKCPTYCPRPCEKYAPHLQLIILVSKVNVMDVEDV